MTCQIESDWIATLARGEVPNADSLKEHLLAVHREHAGFTEHCAGRCRDDAGRTSYDWLAELLGEGVRGRQRILDLACGSGPLLSVCADRQPHCDLVGIDMSLDELSLARTRLGPRPVTLHHAMAQDMPMVETESVDVVLCHWALTLMAPLEPVLSEVARVLRRGGLFAAIVDGPPDIAPGYTAVDDTIFEAVARVAPLYGSVDLGDPRVRNANTLRSLARSAFPEAEICIEPSVMKLKGPPQELASEALGFFYASFVLAPEHRAILLEELSSQFERRLEDCIATFSLPVSRLMVRLPPG
ncbi:MAG: class I SAM-dependent methyltransferase [Pseudomonadota bacterium]